MCRWRRSRVFPSRNSLGDSAVAATYPASPMDDCRRPSHYQGATAVTTPGTHLPRDDSARSPAPTAHLAVEVIEKNASYVGRVLRRLGVQVSDLPDAKQDVFLIVWRRFGDFEHRSSVTTWLYTICRRVAKDQRRRAHRRYEGFADIERARCDLPLQEQTIEARERLACVEQAYRELSYVKQDALLRVGIEGEDVRDAAADGCSEKTVFSRLYAARDHLRRALEKAGHMAGAPVLTGPSLWQTFCDRIRRAATHFVVATSCAASVALVALPATQEHRVLVSRDAPTASHARLVPFELVAASKKPSAVKAAPATLPAAPPPVLAEADPDMEFSILQVQSPSATLALRQVGLLEFEVVIRALGSER